jgi:heterokaryon incompatibility protein (HET)
MRALTRLHNDDPLTPVWFNAICIDQQNFLERNHQVGIMSRIYSAANKVQIDLGEGDEKTAEAIDFIQEITSLENPTELLYFQLTSCSSPSVQQGITTLLNHSWFERRWVLQEAHFAKYAEVLCGEKKLPWRTLRLLGQDYVDYKIDLYEQKLITVSLPTVR